MEKAPLSRSPSLSISSEALSQSKKTRTYPVNPIFPSYQPSRLSVSILVSNEWCQRNERKWAAYWVRCPAIMKLLLSSPATMVRHSSNRNQTQVLQRWAGVQRTEFVTIRIKPERGSESLSIAKSEGRREKADWEAKQASEEPILGKYFERNNQEIQPKSAYCQWNQT